MQLNGLVQDASAAAVKAGVIDCKRLNPQADFKRVGRYAYLGPDRQSCIWFGVHFDLWKRYGRTPTWVIFSDEYGRSHEVRPLLEPWAAARVFSVKDKGDFAVALDLPAGEGEEAVISAIVERLRQMGEKISVLNSRKIPSPTPENG